MLEGFEAEAFTVAMLNFNWVSHTQGQGRVLIVKPKGHQESESGFEIESERVTSAKEQFAYVTLALHLFVWELQLLVRCCIVALLKWSI